MTRPWPRRSLAIAVLAAAFVACDPLPANQAAGVTTAEGRTVPEFLYVLCPDERLERFQLIDQVGDSPYDDDDEVLWEIRSEGAAVDEVRLGVVPTGFAEEVPLEADVGEFDELVAVFDTSSTTRFGVGFDPDDLAPGRVVMFDGSVEALEKFKEDAESRCQ